MSDTWGASFPVDSDSEQSSDKALSLIGAALQAAINADLGPKWEAIAPGTLPVAHVFPWDPKHKFNESKLPALYIFEQSSITDVTADELDIDTRTLALYWVARMSSKAHETLREQARHIIGKIVARLCRFGRHPAWIDAGDTDTMAPTRGSFLFNRAGINSMVRLQASPLELAIALKGEEGQPEPFRGWMTQLRIQELSEFDATIGTVPTTSMHTVANIGTGTDVIQYDPLTVAP
jgi:hypothetical protein